MIVLDYEKNTELFNNTAQEWADRIIRTKKSQVRNFYDKLLELEDKSKNLTDDEFKKRVLPFVKMLNSKVAYAVNRRVASREFQEMMQDCIKQVDSIEKLHTFKLFFEAVIGFYKGRD